MTTKTDTLTPQQAAAADLLAFGATVTDVAETVKVSRQIVSKWLHHFSSLSSATAGETKRAALQIAKASVSASAKYLSRK